MKPNFNFKDYICSAPVIGVFGSDSDICNGHAREVAYDTGHRLAHAGAIVVTGGGPGVMEEACKGAVEAGGLTIGISPKGKFEDLNPYCLIKIPTEIGYARLQVITNTCHGAILIHGGCGTRQEAEAMYFLRRPTVAIRTTGGTAAEYAGKVLDGRNLDAILSADDSESAVKLVFEEITRRTSSKPELYRSNKKTSIAEITGKKLRTYRTANDLTQREVAEKLGVVPSMIAKYETGKHEIPKYVALLLTHVFPDIVSS